MISAKRVCQTLLVRGYVLARKGARFTLCSGGTAVQQSTAPRRGFSMLSKDASGLLYMDEDSDRTFPSIANHNASLEMHRPVCQYCSRMSAMWMRIRGRLDRVDHQASGLLQQYQARQGAKVRQQVNLKCQCTVKCRVRHRPPSPAIAMLHLSSDSFSCASIWKVQCQT